jgi:SAM-dependent methyltransferase
MSSQAKGMRSYWDARARENAAWYVDTTCDYAHPDMEAFFATGPKVVEEALLNGPVKPAGRDLAVEIGPGLGRICRALGEHFNRVIGIDISEEMVSRARQLVPDPAIRFEVGNGTDLQPIETASADFVLTFTVLQHLTSASLVEGYLRDAGRVLKPGGVLAAQWNNTPKPLSWRARVAWLDLRNRIGGPLATDTRDVRQFLGTRVPFEAMRSALKGSGMEVRGTKGLGTLFGWVWAEKVR